MGEEEHYEGCQVFRGGGKAGMAVYLVPFLYHKTLLFLCITQAKDEEHVNFAPLPQNKLFY